MISFIYIFIYFNLIIELFFILGWFYIQLPACDGIIISLIKNKLFSATPCNPLLAFAFEVFELYYELMFEAHVSYLAFCKVLEALQGKQIITQVSFLV